ncbi:MAG: ComF family protein [Gammaproteobacteria bacterium]|nr:ComF family protein [Gammaproteobacteria bacterium]
MKRFFLTNHYLKSIILFCLDHLLPLSCLLCRKSCDHPKSLCTACQQLILPPEEFSQYEVTTLSNDCYWQAIRCLSAYQTPIKEIIHQGKFNKNLASLKLLGQLFAEQLLIQTYDPELVLVPVPLHPSRLMERGYNQALEITLPIAKTLQLTINHQCVTRIDKAKTQHFLKRQQRIDNAQDIFQAIKPVPKKIAIIDDVYTTGSTMRSLCSCLQKTGAQTIEVWIIARTPKQS